MEFLLGVCLGLVVTLVVALVWILSDVRNKFGSINTNIDEIRNLVAKTPAAQNVIHLGLKESQTATGLVPATLSIRREDFQIQADKLYSKLMNGLKVKAHPDTGVNAYCILTHAGLNDMVDRSSWREAQAALTRLLNNQDEDATSRFLKTLADSVASAQVMASSDAPITTH